MALEQDQSTVETLVPPAREEGPGRPRGPGGGEAPGGETARERAAAERQRLLGNGGLMGQLRMGPVQPEPGRVRVAQAATGTMNDATPGAGEGRTGVQPMPGGENQGADEVPAIGSDTEVNAEGLRTTWANNPRALAALNTITADANFARRTPAEQGALLARFQQAPNGATAQYVRGILAYHSGHDRREGLAAFRNARDPDGGSFTTGGTAYTVQNGRLLNPQGQEAGNIHTDGTYQLTGQTGRTSVYDDITNRVHLTEGTGREQRTLLNLHNADPGGRLDNPNINGQFATRARSTLRDMRKEGVDMRVTDGFRSFQEQDGLYEQGRTRPGNRVTNARGGQSWHNYGVAMDSTFQDPNGTPHWREDGDYARLWQRYGEVGQRHGLYWGGNFRNVDNPHHEYHPNDGAGGARNHEPTLRRQGLREVWRQMGIGE